MKLRVEVLYRAVASRDAFASNNNSSNRKKQTKLIFLEQILYTLEPSIYFVSFCNLGTSNSELPRKNTNNQALTDIRKYHTQ